MIELNKYMPPEVVPQDELHAWRDSVRKTVSSCPNRIGQFIVAAADQLPAFGQIRTFKTMITGYELKLSGMKEYNGEYLVDTFAYELPVPHMVAVDHYSAMTRAYTRRGQQGLIDYVKAHAHADAVEKLLYVLDSVVFEKGSEAFRKEMQTIKKAA